MLYSQNAGSQFQRINFVPFFWDPYCLIEERDHKQLVNKDSRGGLRKISDDGKEYPRLLVFYSGQGRSL